MRSRFYMYATARAVLGLLKTKRCRIDLSARSYICTAVNL
jgi:hypothetical protein